MIRTLPILLGLCLGAYAADYSYQPNPFYGRSTGYSTGSQYAVPSMTNTVSGSTASSGTQQYPGGYWPGQPSDTELRKIVREGLRRETLPRLKEELKYILNPCDREFIYFKFTKKCYFSPEHDRRTFFAAKAQCSALGGSLATFNDRYTQMWISNLGVRRDGTGTNPNDQDAWVGSTRSGTTVSNANGTPFNANSDLYQDPSTAATGEDCMYVSSDGIGSGFISCNLRRNYVCEKARIERPPKKEADTFVNLAPPFYYYHPQPQKPVYAPAPQQYGSAAPYNLPPRGSTP